MKYLYFFFAFSIGLLLFSCQQNNKDNMLKKHNPVGMSYFKKAHNYKKSYKFDSAYVYFYKAIQQFMLQKDSVKLAKAYFQLGVIDYYNRNINSSEAHCISSLKYVSKKQSKLKAQVYNLLGVSAKTNKNYSEAIQYFNKYRNEYQQFSDTLVNFIAYENNIANVYKEQEQYEQAIKHYNIILSVDNLLEKHSNKYARVLDSKAWSLYKNKQNDQVLSELLKAKSIRKNNNTLIGLIGSYLHLSEYYFDNNQLKKAFVLAQKAHDLSKKLNSPMNLLEALLLEAKIDKKNGTTYFLQYQKIHDSLLNKERMFKNQTAKIRFETQEKENKIYQQNLQLKQSKRRQLWLVLLLSLLFTAVAVFVRLWRKITIKNRKILSNNEELFSKNTIINEQHKLLEEHYGLVQTLQKEIHHRVKNNLSIIDRFIRNIKKKNSDILLLHQLSDLQNKIQSIYIVHEQLYKNTDITRLQLRKYIEVLAINVQNLFASKKLIINNLIDEDIGVYADKSSIIGLIINEFLTNSYKYAFPDTENGSVTIELIQTNDFDMLILKDNGIGFPNNFDIKQTKTYGTKLMRTLSLQIEGEYSIVNDNGTLLKIVFNKNSTFSDNKAAKI
jgi:two-component sensor histidine kinase